MSTRRRRRRRKMPAALSDLLGAQARRWKFHHLHRLERVRRVWPQAAGDYVARHASPVRLMHGSLRLAVVDSTWASELGYLAEEILERLQGLLPAGWVTELKVAQGEVLPPDEVQPRVEPTPLPKASPAMEAAAAELSAEIPDADLADSIRRARLAALRRLDAKDKKGLENSKSQ